MSSRPRAETSRVRAAYYPRALYGAAAHGAERYREVGEPTTRETHRKGNVSEDDSHR